jgi:ribonuclease P protein component
MLRRPLRLTREIEYRAVYDGGRSRRGEAMVCVALAQPGQPTRAGIVASRKVGDAVRRNRAKRRLREALRLVWPELPCTGWHLVLIATPVTVTLDYGRLVDDLRRSLSQLGVLAGEVPAVRPGATPSNRNLTP